MPHQTTSTTVEPVAGNSSSLSQAQEDLKNSFHLLQKQFAEQFKKYYHDWNAPRTVVIIPSLSLDQEILAKISGMVHYEERMLCMLMLLRMPRTHVIYGTSVPIDPVVIDYYLHLLQ